MEQVTPEREWAPTRTYKRVGKIISCFTVIGHQWSNGKLEVGESPIFEFEMPSEEAAINLMHDMYYGEYTGA
ncbi:MAG: hypothetical protein ACJA1I_000562 [Zhongshania marina]|jgi:hypothetical protein